MRDRTISKKRKILHFSIFTGEYLGNPEIKIPTYPVRVVDKEVQLGGIAE